MTPKIRLARAEAVAAAGKTASIELKFVESYGDPRRIGRSGSTKTSADFRRRNRSWRRSMH